MPTLQEMMRLQNMFGSPDFTVGDDMPTSGPSELTAPPIVQPGQDPFANISFGATKMGAPPSMAQPDTATPGMSPDVGEADIAQRMKQIYQPQSDATNKFTELINKYPNRADYKPSIGRRIGSALTMFGRGGPEMATQVLNAPFNNALTDWQNQVKPTAEAANFERYSNTNARMAAYQQVSNELKQHAQEAKERNDATNATIRQQRANVYEYKATHPGMKLAFPKGGNVMAIDSGTGEAHDTGIPTGSMTELDKLNLEETNAIERIGARGNETRKTENVKEGNRQNDIAARGNQSRLTKRVPGGSSAAAKPETPTQTRVRQFNSARQLFNTRPDLKNYITIGKPGSNDFTVAKPSVKTWYGNSSGPTAAQYKEIQDAIYGQQAPAPASSHAATEDRIPIYKDGKAVGTVPIGQKEQAIKEGYTVK